MKAKIYLKFLIAVLIVLPMLTYSQGVAINEDDSEADASAMLDVQSTDKGILIPRMTESQRDNITSPEEGLMIYQTDGTKGFYYHNGTEWTSVSGSQGPTSPGELITSGTGSSFPGNSGNEISIPDLYASLTLTEQSDVLISYQTNVRFNSSNQYVDIRLYTDNTWVANISSFVRSSISYQYSNISNSTVLQLGPGTHSIQVKYNSDHQIDFLMRNMTVKVLGPSL